MPAAIASGLPDSVPAWYTGPSGATCSIRSRRPPYAATGSPPPITLPSVVRSGVDAEALARAAGRDAEAGHHLVEDQQRAVLVGERAQRREEAGIGRDEARVADDRLDDDRGDAAGVLAQQRLDRRRDR